MTEDNDNTPLPDDITVEPDPLSPSPSPGSGSDPLIGTKIGSCTLKRVIGSGGMGTVYEAMQDQPRRRIALKIMKRGITSRSALRRFKLESQTLARLQHPNVVQVYEAGIHDDGHDGLPYFVMEYVSSAKTLTEYATDKGLGTRERLAIFTKVCDAVQHGHLKGIIHRDLKPSNVLVDANGQPKIIDFGVARSTDSDMAVTTLQTDVGQLIGTLQYMSPEQCEADPSDIDARSDVYALGVTLYELLAGRPPYNIRKVAIHEAVRILSEEEPTSLSSFGKHLRGDIEKISRKSLEKNRDHRYQSVVALREDIQSYLDGEKVTAKPSGNAWGTQAKMDLNFGNFVSACLSRKTLCVFLVLCIVIWSSLYILELALGDGYPVSGEMFGNVPNYWITLAQAVSFITGVLFLVYLLSYKSSHDFFMLGDKIAKHKWKVVFLIIYCPSVLLDIPLFYYWKANKALSTEQYLAIIGLAIGIPLAIWLIRKVAKPKIHFHSNGEQKSIPASESAVRTVVKHVVEKRQKVEGEQSAEKPPGITWDSALGEAHFDGENFDLKIPDKKLLVILLAISSVLVFVKLFFFSIQNFEMLICLCPLIAVTGLICLILGFKSSKIIKLACGVLCVFIFYLTVSLIMHWVWKGRVFEFSGSVLPPSEISTPRISGSWLEVEDDIEMNPQIVMPGDLVTFRETSAAQLGTPLWIRLDGGEIHGADQWEATTTFSKVGDVRVRFSSEFMGDVDEMLQFTISVKGTELSILPTYSKYFDDITIIVDFTDFVKDAYETSDSLREGFVIEANLDGEQSFSVEAVGNIQPVSYEWQLLKTSDNKFNELDENGDSLELQLEPGIYKVKVRAALDLYDRVVLTDWAEIDVLVETEVSALFRKVFTEIGHPFAPELWNAALPNVAYLEATDAELVGVEPGFYIGTLTMKEQEPFVSFINPQELLEWLSEQDHLSSVQKETIAGRVHLLDAAKKAYDANDVDQLQEMLDSL